MICSKCNQDRELIDFHKDSRLISGHKNVCRTCVSSDRRKHYWMNKKEAEDKKKATKPRFIDGVTCNECKYLSISEYIFPDGTRSAVCLKQKGFIKFIKGAKGKVSTPAWCYKNNKGD